MHGLSNGIILIGLMYVANPRAVSTGFGLPLPEAGENIGWWLRLKGIRDVVSGLILLAALVWSGSTSVGVVPLIAALTPLGDMATILMAKGSKQHALGIHGVTALLMLYAGALLTMHG